MSAQVIHGIDFSGAKKAGRYTWVTTAHPEDQKLVVTDCDPVCELADGARARDVCMCFLRRLLSSSPGAAVGMDFPFSLPKELIREDRWEDFVAGFADRFGTAESFREQCRSQTNNREPKRYTDVLARVPFCAFNIRIFRQTFHGIRDVLAPLIKDDAVRVLPMQTPESGKATLREICPASTLKKLRLVGAFKGSKASQREARGVIIDELICSHNIALDEQGLRNRIVDDEGGDALDSVIAAEAVWRSIQHPANTNGGDPREGWIYV